VPLVSTLATVGGCTCSGSVQGKMFSCDRKTFNFSCKFLKRHKLKVWFTSFRRFSTQKRGLPIARAMVCWCCTMLYPASGSAGFTSGVGRVSIKYVLPHMRVYGFIGRRGAWFSAERRPVATPPLSLRASHLCVRGRWGSPSSHCVRKISGRFALAREMRMVALPLLVQERRLSHTP